jgi:thiol-disulfide isomerase/thioredoxin
MRTYILLILAVIVISCSSGEKTCTITGGITGRKADALLLFKASRFPVYEAEIPISNNSFDYSFKFSYPEVFILAFKDEFKKGTVRETPFFSEAGKIKFTIPADRDMSGYVVKGKQLNDALINYYKELKVKFYDEAMKYTDSINEMYKIRTVYTKQYQELLDALDKPTDKATRNQLMGEQKFLRNTGSMYSPKAKKLAKMQDSILAGQNLWEAEYIDKNTSLLSFYLLMNRVKDKATSNKWQEVDTPSLNKIQTSIDRYGAAFPGHPYIAIVKNTLEGLSKIHSGGQIIDLTLEKMKGESTVLSSVIKNNRITVLNFWATWCTPSMATNKDLIPVYNSYKDKGLGIVGITPVFGKMDELVSFIQKENYPWTNLVDKDGKACICEKYNLSYKSGGSFLVDPSGKILAVNMTPNNLKEKLVELLK